MAAWSCLSAFVLGTILVFVFAGKTQITRRIPLPEPPQVLASNARRLLQAIGHDQAAVDEVHRFDWGNAALSHVQRSEASPDRWEVLSSGRVPVVYFWYRQGPNPIVPYNRGRWFPSFFDPPPLNPGDVRMLFDAEGRLHQLRIVPEGYKHSDEPSTDVVEHSEHDGIQMADGGRCHRAHDTRRRHTRSGSQQDTGGVWEAAHASTS